MSGVPEMLSRLRDHFLTRGGAIVPVWVPVYVGPTLWVVASPGGGVGVGDGAVADVAAGRTNLPMTRANDTIATARPRWARTDRGPIAVRRRDALARRVDAAVARR